MRQAVRTEPVRVVLLPGMDGTGLLFEPLAAVRPPGFSPSVVAYPSGIGTYAEAERYVLDRLPSDEPYVLVAESFSGPAAVRVAGQRPDGLRGLVLIASFVGPLWPRRLPPPPLAWLRALPFQSRIARLALLGSGADPSLDALLARALAGTPPSVLAERVREVLSVDASEAFRHIAVPVLYLQPTHDRVLGRCSARRIRAIRPDAEYEEIDGPHLLAQRNPEGVWETIEAFVERIQR